MYIREKKRKRPHVLPLPVYARGFLAAVGDVLVSKLSRLWHGFITGKVFDTIVAQFVDLVKDAIAEGKRVVRVLEVGAGTGRLTALLGKALIDANLGLCYVDYVTTDISISLAQEAALKSPWPTMTPMAFDLGVDIVRQGLDPSSFDIVVAFDVLHAVPNIKNTMDTLQRLLLPGGHIAIIELEKVPQHYMYVMFKNQNQLSSTALTY